MSPYPYYIIFDIMWRVIRRIAFVMYSCDTIRILIMPYAYIFDRRISS